VHAPCDFYKILALKEVIVELCGSSMASLLTLSAGLPPALPFDDLRVFILLAVFSPKISNALRDPYNANFGKQFSHPKANALHGTPDKFRGLSLITDNFFWFFWTFLPPAHSTKSGIAITHGPKIRFFAPQGRLVAPIWQNLAWRSGARIGVWT